MFDGLLLRYKLWQLRRDLMRLRAEASLPFKFLDLTRTSTSNS